MNQDCCNIYLSTLAQAFKLTLKNLLAFILFSIYSVVFYLGFLCYIRKQYILFALCIIVFAACLSSIFYITAQIVKTGSFKLKDLPKSFKVYLFRINFIFVFWFAIFFFINQFIITPISSVLKGDLLLYLIIVPLSLAVFFVFNALPELAYLSEDNIESIIIGSINFFEKHWLAWIIPTIIIMFLLNFFDHRLSIMPSIGFLDQNGIMAKIQDRAFYFRSFVLTIALIFRGLLFKNLYKPAIEKR